MHYSLIEKQSQCKYGQRGKDKCRNSLVREEPRNRFNLKKYIFPKGQCCGTHYDSCRTFCVQIIIYPSLIVGPAMLFLALFV